MKRLDAEDIALLVAVLASILSTLIDEVVDSMWFKVLKIVALLVTLALAVKRIRQSKPYFRDISESEWSELGDRFEFILSRVEHGRGRTPYSRCLVKNEYGEFAECFVDAIPTDTGDITVRIDKRVPIRVEVRK